MFNKVVLGKKGYTLSTTRLLKTNRSMILSKFLFEDFFLLVIDVIKPPGTYFNKTLWKRALWRRECGINCECRGIVRNYIFPDSLPYKYPNYSLFE